MEIWSCEEHGPHAITDIGAHLAFLHSSPQMGPADFSFRSRISVGPLLEVICDTRLEAAISATRDWSPASPTIQDNACPCHSSWHFAS